MAIIEKPEKFCPNCKSLLKPSPRGPICRNPQCMEFVSFDEVPLQATVVKKKVSSYNPVNVLNHKNWCCPGAFFDIRTFFESMDYIGSIKSRSNQYYCYRHENMNLISTGLKELTRFNTVHQDDLAEIEKLLNRYMGNESFSAETLRQNCLKFTFESERITGLKYLVEQNKDEFNELYWMMLFSCYILTADGKLSLQKHGHGIEFVKNSRIVRKNLDDSIFNNTRYLYNINDNTAVFDSGPFYLEVRCNGYRGSIVPYTKEEIDYLNTLVDAIPSRKRLDITELMYSMDYSHRFHRLYDLLEWRNIRNDREEKEFFERRIKSGLELVARLHKNLRVDKEGRTKIFIKS